MFDALKFEGILPSFRKLILSLLSLIALRVLSSHPLGILALPLVAGSKGCICHSREHETTRSRVGSVAFHTRVGGDWK